MSPGSIGKVSYTLTGPVPQRVKARARLCLPDLDSRNPLTGAYEPGSIVFVEAQGADESAALAALHLAQTARLTAQRDEHDRPSTDAETGTRARTAKRAQTVTEAATAAIAKMVKAKRLASSSAYVYRLHIVRHLAVSDLGKMAVAEVRPRHVEDYLAALAQGSGQAEQKTGAAATGMATAKAGRAVLNRTFGDARRAELIDSNPMLDVGTIAKPKPKRRSKTEPQGLSHDRALDKSERVTLAWAVARDETAKTLDVRDFVLAGLALGGRIGELSAIRWCDVEFVADGTARVRLAATVDRVTGMGLVRREPKTASSERTVPVARRIAALLRRRALAAGVDLAHLTECELPVFPAPGRWPDQPVVYRDRANTTKVLRAVFDRAGFPWLSMHGLRRTAVTQLADVLPIRQAADFAGHASVRTTLDHYVGRGQVSDRVAALL